MCCNEINLQKKNKFKNNQAFEILNLGNISVCVESEELNNILTI